MLLTLSSDQVTLGAPLDFYGAGFLNNTKAGHTEIHFKGTFTGDTGKAYTVDYRMQPRWTDGNHVMWPYVGPYANPFSGKGVDQMGTFTGEVTAVNIVGDKDKHDDATSDPLKVTLKFGPGLVIRDFQPVQASCSEPAKRVLGGAAYKVTVDAIGFTPVNYSYIVVGEPGQTVPRVYRNLAKGTSDSFGANGELTFAAVPDGQPFYVVGFAVRAIDTMGNEHKMDLAIGVHRPIEYIDSGEVKIAQIEPAKPDSGCLSGGDTNGTTVNYTESHSETRTRTLGLTWNESWVSSVSDTSGGAHTSANSVNWSVNHTDSQGGTFGWNLGAGVMGGAEIPLLAKGSVSLTGGIKQDFNWGHSDGRTVGGDFSESDTESWATTNTSSHDVAQGGSDFWSVSSTDSTSLSFTGLILPGHFGVFYRQVTRVAIPGSVVAYNLCGTPEVVAQANFFDYLWSLELAQGTTCSPLPESKLPAAECVMAPCGSP